EVQILIGKTSEHGLSQQRERVLMLAVREDVLIKSLFFYDMPAAVEQVPLECFIDPKIPAKTTVEKDQTQTFLRNLRSAEKMLGRATLRKFPHVLD
ncbi:unnamed protein product, partial [Symbiodinium sp. CCMP2456]